MQIPMGMLKLGAIIAYPNDDTNWESHLYLKRVQNRDGNIRETRAFVQSVTSIFFYGTGKSHFYTNYCV